MKYRSITLNGNKANKYSLVKYSEDYKKYLPDLKNLNSDLAELVEQCPKIYSELSDHQSYMIFCDNKCVGAIYIGTSCDEKDLEVKMQLDENKFKDETSIIEVIEQIVDSLGLYFYEKENIEIQLINNIDLSKFNQIKYKKRIFDENLITYTCSNSLNNNLILNLINEMNSTEKKFIEWKQCWIQLYEMCNINDLQIQFDEQLMQEYYDITIPLPEVFYKAESVLWKNIISNKSERSINFEKNGNITLLKKSKEYCGNDYEISYNILKDDFTLRRGNWKKSNLEINDNSYSTNIEFQNLNITTIKENNSKIIRYKSPIVNNSSILLELFINKNNNIERCYIDFRTHRNNEKINGTYALRVFSKNEICKLYFISRKGIKYGDYIYRLLPKDVGFFDKTFYESLTIEFIQELINKIVPLINKLAINVNKPTITLECENIILHCKELESEAINYVKQIKGEIPLPHLQDNLEKFVSRHDNKKNNIKKRALKQKYNIKENLQN